MITKKEMLEDIRQMLGIELEWHDKTSCLFDVDKACKIANKYGIKLELSSLDLDDLEIYDLSKEQIKIIKQNQEINNRESNETLLQSL